MAAYNLTDFLACCSAGPGDNYSGPGVFINVFFAGILYPVVICNYKAGLPVVTAQQALISAR